MKDLIPPSTDKSYVEYEIEGILHRFWTDMMLYWSLKWDYLWILLKILIFGSNLKSWSIRSHANKGTSHPSFLINWCGEFKIISFWFCWITKIHVTILFWQAIKLRIHDSGMLEKISLALIFKEDTKIRNHIGITSPKNVSGYLRV